MSIEKIASVIESKAGMLTKASDNIWEYAEMAFREHKSMEELCGILEAEGFEVKKGIGDTIGDDIASIGNVFVAGATDAFQVFQKAVLVFILFKEFYQTEYVLFGDFTHAFIARTVDIV